MRIYPTIWLICTLIIAGCGQSESSLESNTNISSSAHNFDLSGNLTLVGRVPSRYFDEYRGRARSLLARVDITDGIISSVTRIEADEAEGLRGLPNTIIAKRGRRFDFILPGLIDLHNHNTQNMLGPWLTEKEGLTYGKGQFTNRWEWRGNWRGLNEYKVAVRSNINPWQKIGQVFTHPSAACASYRWTELQAMIFGATYVQGASSCISRFAINKVEDLNVSAPTDLFNPDMVRYLWTVVKPIVEERDLRIDDANWDLDAGMKIALEQDCPGMLEALGIDSTLVRDSHKQIKSAIADYCSEEAIADKKIKNLFSGSAYLYGSLAGRLNSHLTKYRSLIVHLSEGRRNDPVNRMEFDFARLVGILQPHVNFVHGLGIDEDGYQMMADRDVGLIISVFSNLMLYGETIDFRAAAAAGVRIAVGSDWTPTGSKSSLEELKFVLSYLEDQDLIDVIEEGYGKSIYEFLYEAVTENPAFMMNAHESSEKFAGIGHVRPGYRGSLIIVRNRTGNPYRDLVNARERDINLVSINGQPLYGDKGYLAQALGLSEEVDEFRSQVETLPKYFDDVNHLGDEIARPQLDTFLKWETGEAREAQKQRIAWHREDIASYLSSREFESTNNCRSGRQPMQKGMLHIDSQDERVAAFREQTGLDLDRAADLQLFLGAHVMTQTYNANLEFDAQRGSTNLSSTLGVPDRFSALYTCNDPVYSSVVEDYIETWKSIDRSAVRQAMRDREQLPTAVTAIARKLNIEYDPERNY